MTRPAGDDCSAGEFRGSWVIGGWIIALAWSGTVLADDKLIPKLIPYGSAQAEYNSNIFALPDQQRAVDDNGNARRADTVLRYLAGIEANLPLSNQKLRAVVEGRRLQYIHFGRLDHNEYLLSGGLDWRLTSALDGALDYRQERRLAPFAERNTTDLTLERERIVSGSLNLDLSPKWRLETGLRSRELDSPLAANPEFSLKEDAVNAALKYAIEDTLAAGLYAEYLSGRFEGVADAGDFHQESLGLSADYSISGLTRIGAQLGYSRRQDDGSGGTQSGLTGMLSYHRELTGKTTLDVQAFRRLRSDVGGASSVRETGAGATLAWQPTEKVAVTGIYQWTTGRFEESVPTSTAAERTEDNQLASLKLNYQMLPWLAMRPYGGYQERDSDLASDSFHTAIAGIELLARFR